MSVAPTSQPQRHISSQRPSKSSSSNMPTGNPSQHTQSQGSPTTVTGGQRRTSPREHTQGSGNIPAGKETSQGPPKKKTRVYEGMNYIVSAVYCYWLCVVLPLSILTNRYRGHLVSSVTGTQWSSTRVMVAKSLKLMWWL